MSKAKQVIDPYGYFVLTSGIYAANMGGLSGANAICLNELTSQSWKGKTGAIVLDNSTIKAFLCSSTECQNPAPGIIFKAALAGSTTIGGGLITVDSNGAGPYDVPNWSTSTYFGSSQYYWTGREDYDQVEFTQLVEDYVFPTNIYSNLTCLDWTSTSGNAIRGYTYSFSSTAGGSRWRSGTTACTGSFRLMCFVDPTAVLDREPDTPTITNVISAEPNSVHTVSFAVTGINTPVYAFITNNEIYNPSSWAADIRNVTTGGPWLGRVQVNPGDTLEVRSSAFPRFSAQKTVKISVGTSSYDWQITTRLSNPQLGKRGFLVRSDLRYSGSLGGLAGANQICLEESNNRWAYRGEFDVSSSNVKAFLCDGSSCNNLNPNTKYTFDMFGYSNGSSVILPGGATIYSDGSGLGPNSQGSWFISSWSVSSNLFGQLGTIWTGRAAGTNWQWASTSHSNHCNGWADGTSGFMGGSGSSSEMTSGRWANTNETCDTNNYILCILNPPTNGFGFDDVLNASTNTLYSRTLSVSGLTSAISVTVIKGSAEIRKNSDVWGAAIASVNNGDTVDIRMTSSSLKNGKKIALIQAGDLTIDWAIRNADTASNDEQVLDNPSFSDFTNIAISGSTLAAASATNKIYIFIKSGSTWAYSETITTTTNITSLDIDGNTIAVGYKGYSGVYPDAVTYTSAGSILIIQKGADWASATQTLILPASGVLNWMEMGASVAIEGNLVVTNTEAGSKAYVFQNTGGGWAAATETILSTDVIYQARTHGVATKGNTIVVGTGPVNTYGRIHTFENTGSGWASATKTTIYGSESGSNDYYGVSVDISDDEQTIVVGAPALDMDTSKGHFNELGKIFVYEKGASWSSSSETILAPAIAHSYVNFGQDVRIQGNLIAASARRDSGEGALYLFKKGPSWNQATMDVVVRKTTSSLLTGPYDHFGDKVNLCGDTLVGLSPESAPSATYGRIYVYDVSPLTSGATCD